MLRAAPLFALFGLTALSPTPRAGDDFRERVAPLLEHSCAKCHSGAEPEGELSFEAFLDPARPAALDLSTWRKVRKQLASGKMPPRKEPRPPPAELERALAAIDAKLAAESKPADPGRVTLSRLNRVQYESTVRDLLGVAFDAEQFFPLDDAGYGFDNIGDVLSMPDILLEKYVAAAERIAEQAIVVADPARPPARRIRDDEIVHTEKFTTHGGSWALYSSGFVGVDFDFARAGEYRLRARAWAQQAGPETARMVFRFGTAEVASFEVLASESDAQVYECTVEAEFGKSRFSAEFVNDYWNPDEPDRKKRDRNLYVEWLEVAGPVGFSAPSEFQRRFLAEDRDLRTSVRELAERAWRRPTPESDVERLLALAQPGAPREGVLQTVLVALLSSPRFLFRVESDPPGAAPGSVRDLDDFELASRLSYYLWSTMPDDALFDAARRGELRDPAKLEVQARRMLRDPRASALVRDFAGQWLQLRTLERVEPDRARFPHFDDQLRAAMRAETEMLFEAVLREERPVSDLIDPDFTFLNERLAKHYGLSGVEGPNLRRVRLDPATRETRGGLLEQGSMLTVTSNPTRTSPVKRGKWVLETLLGSPPLAPQPGVDSLDERPEAVKAASLRERLAKHRADPKCAVCHDRMDNLGFALENFDPTGRWRSEADGFAVDASGVLDDGSTFVGPALLEKHLARDPAFVRCLCEKLAIYALGRGLRPEDEPAIDELAAELGPDPTLSEIVLAVARLDSFRRRVVAEKP